MKDLDKQREQDQIWKKVCGSLHWCYFPSLFHYISFHYMHVQYISDLHLELLSKHNIANIQNAIKPCSDNHSVGFLFHSSG